VNAALFRSVLKNRQLILAIGQRTKDWPEQRTTKMGNIRMHQKLTNITTAIPFIILCFRLPSPASAQDNVSLLGASPAANHSRELLKRADVQKELGIDAYQKDALADMLRQSDQPIVVHPVVEYQDISRLSDDERKRWQADINRQAAEQTTHILNERRRMVEEILRPDQRKRLMEIDLQWRGLLALGDESLSERLGISSPFQQSIAVILSEFEAKRVGLSSPSGKPEKTHSPRYETRRVLWQEAEQKVLALLSDEEKSRWAQAVGKPFKFEIGLK
jgi:hypothetical protein